MCHQPWITDPLLGDERQLGFRLMRLPGRVVLDSFTLVSVPQGPLPRV